MTMAPTSINQARWELLFFAAQTVAWAGIAIFFAWGLLTGNYFYGSTRYVILFMVVLGSVCAPVFLWHFILAFFEARDAAVIDDVVTLSYLHSCNSSLIEGTGSHDMEKYSGTCNYIWPNRWLCDLRNQPSGLASVTPYRLISTIAGQCRTKSA